MNVKQINSTIHNIFLFSICIIVFTTCKKIEREPKVETGNVSDITTSSAKAEGNIIDIGDGISTHGHCWSINSNPMITDSKTFLGRKTNTGSFTSNIQSLQPGTKYYLRAYAQGGDKVFYGNELSFTTTSVVVATITTTPVSVITSTTATSGGNITTDGGGTITERGVCWATTANPTTANNKTSDGTGSSSFTSNITGLLPGTTYHLRAYATNSAGTAYGNELTFTTSAVVPTLTTTAVSAITQTTATSGGNITSNGGAAVTARGVCWSISPGPTITGSHTSDGSGSGIFSSNITGLTPGTLYYVRAYATNNVGTAYGNERTFTTSPVIVPTLTTTAISSPTATTAISGGNITSSGGGAITARGVCWSTSSNPTTSNNKTNDGTGTGVFTSSINGLTANTTYYVRAYATNSAGSGYGNQISFTTDPATITDADGNIYNVIRIGTQLWMKENLKTTKYNDGTNIPLVTDNTAWSNLKTPGYCWYDNDAATYKELYGALYNWWVVNTGKLCLTGWHVPSDSEWTILTSYLGGESVAGGKLKETGTIHWASPNLGATNETNFTALPSSNRDINGVFINIGYDGYWWSANENDANNAIIRYVDFGVSDMSRSMPPKNNGFSVRCIKD